MAQPSIDDLLQMIKEEGFALPDGFDAQRILEEAIWQTQAQTGWNPIWPAHLTYSFDPPTATSYSNYGLVLGGSRVLNLKGKSLLAVTSLTVDGTLLVLGTDFFIDPNGPTRWIRFARPVYGPVASVVIEGDWGYSQNPPIGFNNAALAYAAEQIAAELLQILTNGGVVEARLDDMAKKYGENPLSGFRSAMRRRYQGLWNSLKDVCRGAP